GSFVRPGQLVGYGAMGSAGFRGMGLSGFRTPYNGNRFMAGRSAFGSMDAGRSRAWGRNGDEDRDRFDRRRRSFINWYLNTYSPNWLGYGYGYPYTINPGFFDWGDTDDSGYDQGGEYDQGGAAPAYPPPYPDEGSPYPDEGYAAPNEQPVAAAPAAPEPDQTLLLILKSGGAPVKVQNYMMTAKVLTVLDPQHYQQIPLDQIDLAATRRVNSAAGVEFQVPDASRE
ncbi:MAG TPA: hypothetical protein VMD55_11275, partial [Terracidiphilus sp.]|nr:hypothetical protein [Terracidiphilus sp.]